MTEDEKREPRTFRAEDLSGARFVDCYLSGAVVRGSSVAGMEIDDPWLLEQPEALIVNGVDVAPYVDAELDRRFPGRSLRKATDPEGLRAAWAAVEEAWTPVEQGAVASGSVDRRVDGEWSFAQTLRHLVMATDTWLGRAVREEANPYHPAGLPNDDDGGGTQAYEGWEFSATDPTWDEVVEARRSRQAQVRDFLAGVTVDDLRQSRRNPHDPSHGETVASCLRTILDEEWEHLRYAVRDLAALDAEGALDVQDV